jgi:hypothetical protein
MSGSISASTAAMIAAGATVATTAYSASQNKTPSVGALPAAPKIEDPSISAAAEEERRRRMAAGGRASTVLTGGQGLGETAPGAASAKKVLLGA